MTRQGQKLEALLMVLISSRPSTPFSTMNSSSEGNKVSTLTLESGISVPPGNFGKNNKRSPINTLYLIRISITYTT